jgi:hypothetical protein
MNQIHNSSRGRSLNDLNSLRFKTHEPSLSSFRLCSRLFFCLPVLIDLIFDGDGDTLLRSAVVSAGK